MPDLKRHAFVAVGSSWLLSFAGDGIRLVTMMVLARLLLPEDYGTFALATSVTGWLAGLGFSNFSPNILREKGEPGEIATYLLFGLALHGTLASIGLGVAALLWFLLDRPVVGALVAIATLALPLQVPAQIEGQMLQREFRWRAVRLWQLFTMLAGSAISILLASQGFGPFALLAGVLFEPLPLAALLLATRPLAPLRIVPAVRARMRAFGWPMLGCYVCWATRNLTFTWSVGTVLGADSLGLLNRALGLAALVLGRYSGQTAYSLLPVLAKASGSDVHKAKSGRLLLRSAVWIQLPLAVVLVMLAEPAIRILYGDAWLNAVPLVGLVVPLVSLSSTLDVLGAMVLATGRPHLRMMWEGFSAIGTIACIPFLFHGLSYYIISCAVVSAITLLIAGFAAARCGWLTFHDVRDALLPASCAATIGSTAAISASYLFADINHAAISVTFFGLAYLMSLRVFFSDLYLELAMLLPLERVPHCLVRFVRPAAPSIPKSTTTTREPVPPSQNFR